MPNKPVHIPACRPQPALPPGLSGPLVALAKACHYDLNQWEAFTRFLEDGGLPLSNDAAERERNPPRRCTREQGVTQFG